MVWGVTTTQALLKGWSTRKVENHCDRGLGTERWFLGIRKDLGMNWLWFPFLLHPLQSQIQPHYLLNVWTHKACFTMVSTWNVFLRLTRLEACEVMFAGSANKKRCGFPRGRRSWEYIPSSPSIALCPVWYKVNHFLCHTLLLPWCSNIQIRGLMQRVWNPLKGSC